MTMNDDSKIRSRNLYRIVYVAICFAMLFSAFTIAQNLATQIYKEYGYNSLGQACVFTINIFFCFANITFAAYIKRLISHKAGLFIGGASYAVFVVVGSFTTSCNKFELDFFLCSETSIYVLNLAFCMIVGLGGSLLWLTQADYVNRCCDEKTKGVFNSVFWSLMQTSQVIGSVMGTFVLGITDQFVFYMVLLGFAAIAVVMFSLTPRLENCVLESTAQEPKETLKESVKKLLSALKRPASSFMLIIFFMIGIVLAFYSSFLSTVVDETIFSNDTNVINERMGFVLIALAIGEVSAGLSIGRMADSVDTMKLLHAVVFIPELALALTLIAHITKLDEVGILAGFLWGFSDTALNSMMTIIIGGSFGGSLEMFCLMRSLTGLGVVYGSALAFVLGSQVLLYILITVGTLLVLHALFVKLAPRSLVDKAKENVLFVE